MVKAVSPFDIWRIQNNPIGSEDELVFIWNNFPITLKNDWSLFFAAYQEMGSLDVPLKEADYVLVLARYNVLKEGIKPLTRPKKEVRILNN